MKTQLLIAVVLLTGTGAMAQTNVPSQTQITQTRDFVSGLINRISSGSPNRFNISRDYEQAGPALQARITQALKDYRDTMDIMAQGALASSIEQYNAVVRDGSISSSEKAARLSSLFQSLTIQANAARATYQAALAGLYRIEQNWIVSRVDGSNRKTKINFANGNRYNLPEKDSYENQKSYPDLDEENVNRLKKYVEGGIQAQIKETLNRICSTQACLSSMIADYSAYLNDVNTMVNSDLNIPLADGKVIKIPSLKVSPEWRRYSDLISALSTYRFDDAEFTRLPLRN